MLFVIVHTERKRHSDGGLENSSNASIHVGLDSDDDNDSTTAKGTPRSNYSCACS